MSGHNPHSHLSQPNSSWNPLQIPSYIPRQPQLAHMSNERPLVRSPLTWHTPSQPTPPEAFYSFLSNHKNLELNPLLPSFVRGPSPFGSVDLTIQSARNNTTPSPRNLASSPPSHEFPGHNKSQPLQQQPFTPQHHQQQHTQHQPQIPRSSTPSNSSNIPPPSGPGVIQSTGSVRDKFHCGTSNSNNNGELTQPQLPPTAANIFVRDARQINNEIAKLAARENAAMEASLLAANEPVELIKENPYQLMKSHTAVPTSPKRLSPTRPPSIPNCVPLSPRPRSPLATLINTGSATDIVNNHNVKTSGNGAGSLASQKPEPAPAITPTENSPLSLTLPASPTTTTSNEDSVDSQTSKSRRKRKPNKTTRVSNDSDESMPERSEMESSMPKSTIVPNEQPLVGMIPDKSETLIDLDSNKVVSSNNTEPSDVINSNELACQSDKQTQEGSREPSNVTRELHESKTNDTVEMAETNATDNIPNTSVVNGDESEHIENRPNEELTLPRRPTTPLDEPASVIVNNTSVSAANRNGPSSPSEPNHSNTQITNSCQDTDFSPTSPVPDQQEESDEKSANIVEREPTPKCPADELVTSAENHLDSPRKRCKRKGDSDDIETIDKIAAMIASTRGTDDDDNSVNINTTSNVDNLAVLSQSVEETPVKNVTENTEKEAQPEDTQTQTETSKINDLAELLETPPEGGSPAKEMNNVDPSIQCEPRDTKENAVENCFEEVENKLEEMFAGIEDEEPSPCILPTPTIDDPITPEVISELGLDAVPSPQKQKTSLSSTSSEEPLSEPTTHRKDESTSKPSNHHNSNQKRSHSNSKSESAPPSKKRKMSKKSNQSSSSSSNQKSTGAGYTSSSSSKPSKSASSGTTSHSIKSSKSNDKQQPSTSKEKDKVKEELVTVEYKGPFIQVKSDGTINVINAPTTEDVVEKQKKVKKSIHNHSNSDRSKIRGLHVSTLSIKYDADTTDTTWMCVFCKKGPHRLGLGDLFGPYIITTTCDGFVYSQKDPNDDDFISRRTKNDMIQKHVNGMPVVPASNSSLALSTVTAITSISNTNNSFTSKKKRKNNDSPFLVQGTTSFPSTPPRSTTTASNFDMNDIYLGMTKVSDTSYEVWVHENCVVWSSGVYIIGARIVDLDTAVWSSTRYRCSICSKNGAMISCMQRGCNEKAHIPCARLQNWILDEDEFKCACAKHSSTLQLTSS